VYIIDKKFVFLTLYTIHCIQYIVISSQNKYSFILCSHIAKLLKTPFLPPGCFLAIVSNVSTTTSFHTHFISLFSNYLWTATARITSSNFQWNSTTWNTSYGWLQPDLFFSNTLQIFHVAATFWISKLSIFILHCGWILQTECRIHLFISRQITPKTGLVNHGCIGLSRRTLCLSTLLCVCV